jgi:lysophospholipase L1-like esterase
MSHGSGLSRFFMNAGLALSLGSLFGSGALAGGLLVKPHDFLAICGDSITYQQQYSVFIEDYLLMCQRVEGLQVDQFGSGGETVPGFVTRLAREVLPFHPSFATLFYGMNDGGMNAAVFNPADTQIAARFREGETKAIHALRTAGVRNIVVGSPGCVDSHYFHQNRIPPDVYNRTLQQLTDVARDVAQKEGLPFAEVHGLMSRVMADAKKMYGDAYPIAGDGVHPSANGHLVIAYSFLKALGCDGGIGTVTVDLGNNAATASAGHTIIGVQGGEVKIESTRYPFCFWGDPSAPDATDGVTQFFPFNQDLNRFILIVKGLKTSKAKIVWGNSSKEYASTELSTGVNIAADLLNNPFFGKFQEVDKAVRLQQQQEATLVNILIRNQAELKSLAPGQSAMVDTLIDKAIQRDTELAAAARALVTPVTHTIRIEPLP